MPTLKAAAAASSSASPSCFSFFSAICRRSRRDSCHCAVPIPDATTEANLEPETIPEPSPAPAPLEALPFEIQRLILSQVPTIDDLRALVHASPQLHRVYVEDRAPILREFVERAFDGFLVDAQAAYRSGTDDFQLSRTEAALWEFVDDYQQRLSETVARSDLLLEHLVQMVRFHCSIIEPLTERYATWALAALSSSPQDYPLSDTERRRIQRGFYRLQVFCNVCGFRGTGQSAEECIGYSDPVESLRVLSLFPAWQIEEMLCAHAFVMDVYGGIFHQVAWDLDEERNPRYQHVDLWSVNEYLLLFSSPECGKPNLIHNLWA